MSDTTVNQNVGNNQGQVAGIQHQPAAGQHVVQVNLPQPPVTQHDPTHSSEEEHLSTIKLIYELASRLEHKIDALDRKLDVENKSLIAGQQQLERRMDEISAAVVKAVKLPPNYLVIFGAAFFMLFAPVITYYHDAKLLFGISWQSAYVFAFLCTGISAVLWWYLFFANK